MMRTTVNLPDDIYHLARSVARAKDISLGDAIAELVRQGLDRPLSIQEDHGVPCFTVPPGTPAITLEHTLAVEDEL